jgi:hypothetical protein
MKTKVINVIGVSVVSPEMQIWLSLLFWIIGGGKSSMKRGSRFDFRRIYLYTCRGCGKKRGTRIYERREKEVCTLCTKHEVNKNQLELGVLEVVK